MNLLNRKAIYKTLAAIGTVSVSMALQACSSSDDTAATAATSTEATITGTLSVARSSSARLSKLGRGIAGNASHNADSVAGKTMVCVDPEGNQVGEEAIIGDDGSFSVQGSTEYAISCSIVDSDGNVDGSLVFENPSQTGMDGNPQITDAQQFNGSANLGTVVLDPDSGNAKADMTNFLSQVKTVEVDAASIVALSGYYKIGGYDIPDAAKKAGIKSVCPPETPDSHKEGSENECNGPPEGFALYLNLNHGTTESGADVFPMMLWQTKASFEACGSVVGASAEELKSEMGITLDSGAGEFTYDSTVTVNGQTVTLIDGWKPAGATSDWDMQDCSMTDDGDDHVWACTDTSGAKQMSRGGGCYQRGTTTPVQPDMGGSWGAMTCTNTTTADGYNHSECSGSMSVDSVPTDVTCINESKILKADGTVGTYSDFHWDQVTVKIHQGADCSTAADELTKLRCYSNAYYQQGVEQAQNACVPRIRTDWTANTAEDFIQIEGPKFIVRALGTVGQTPSGQPVLTGLGYHEEQRGVQVENSSGQRQYVACRVGNKEKISIAKSDTDGVLLATYESTSRLLTTGVPACDKEYSNAAPERFMFKFTAISDADAEAIISTQDNH